LGRARPPAPPAPRVGTLLTDHCRCIIAVMNKRILPGLTLGGAAMLVSCAQFSSNGPPLVVAATRDGEGCRVSVEGQRVTNDQLLETGRRARARRGIVLFDRDTPYKCVGGAVFTLQQAGVRSVDVALWNGP
jgi:hypothetical protein